MNKTRSLLFLSLLLISFNSWGRNCDNQSGARHFNPNDEVGNPTGGFVASTAKVAAGVFLGPNVEVCDRAIVSTLGSDTPRIEDEVKVYGRAKISGNVTIKNQVEIFGGAKLEASGINHILVREKAKIYGYAKLSNNARVQGNAIIAGTVRIEANGRVCKDNKLERAEYVFNRFDFCPIPYAEFKINRNQSNINFPNREVSFDAIDSSERNGSYLTLRYIWDFGDQSDEGENEKSELTHSYRVVGKYFVKLTAIDKNGESDYLTLPLEVELPLNTDPISFIKADVFATKKNHLTVNFNGSDSSDEDGMVVSYDWDFGDGTTATGPKPIHQFIGPGVFTVALKVTDELGGFNTSYAEITVNCEQEIGDTTCSRIIGHDDRIIPVDDDFEIELVPNLSPMSNDRTNLEVYIESTRVQERIDVKSIASIVHGRLKIDMQELLKKNIDLRDEFELSFNVDDDSGVGHTSSIQNIYFGSGTIKGRVTDRKNATVILQGAKFKDIRKEIRLGSSGEFEFRNLPFDGFNLIAKTSTEYISELVVAFPNQEIEKNLTFVPVVVPIPNKSNDYIPKQFIKIIKDNDPRSNFTIEKMIFTPDKVGAIAITTHSKPIPIGKTKAIIAFKLFSVDEIVEDVVNIKVFADNLKEPIDKTIDIKSVLAPNLPSLNNPLTSGNWETIEVDLGQSLKANDSIIKVEISATAKDRTNVQNPKSCGSALGVGIFFEENKPRILAETIRRTDGHGVGDGGYFPTTIDRTETAPDRIENKISHSYNKGWFLEFSMQAVMPTDQSFKGLKISVSDFYNDKNSEKFLFRDITDLEIDHKNVYSVKSTSTIKLGRKIVDITAVLPIQSLENSKIDWLSTWKENSAKKVNFIFSVITDKYPSNPEKFPLTPLYNNRLGKCLEYSGVIDRYMTFESFKTLEEMTQDKDLFLRLYCNDGALPFGGLFHPHGGHREGKSLDIRYLTTLSNLNVISKSGEVRRKLIEDSLKYNDNIPGGHMYKLIEWLDDLRKGFRALGEFNVGNGAKQGNIKSLLLSEGGGLVLGGSDVTNWNELLVYKSSFPKRVNDAQNSPFFLIPILDDPKDCKLEGGSCSEERYEIKYKLTKDKEHLNHHHIEFIK